jgi:uncharacterized protein YwgA
MILACGRFSYQLNQKNHRIKKQKNFNLIKNIIFFPKFSAQYGFIIYTSGFGLKKDLFCPRRKAEAKLVCF